MLFIHTKQSVFQKEQSCLSPNTQQQVKTVCLGTNTTIQFQQVENNLILTHIMPHIFQDSQSAVCCLLDESAEQGERRHPLDRIPNMTSPYPLCFAWLISGLSNWTGMTICFSHFYDLEHLKNKKVGQNIFVHLFKRYWQHSSRLPHRNLLNLGDGCSIHITMASACIRNGSKHLL